MTMPLKFTAVLLAAGLSSRMGGRNKLLIDFGGEALVRRVVRAYLEAGARVHVVLGHEAELVQAALTALPVAFVDNPRYMEGQAVSVRAGLASVGTDCDAVLVALGDQAALTAEDVRALLQAFTHSDRSHALIPFHRGQRGNPVVFPLAIARRMLAESEGISGRNFLNAHPELVLRYEAENDHFIRDIDTPEDLAEFLSKGGSK
jgi:molybdenum cofactor cytidylyltransferase